MDTIKKDIELPVGKPSREYYTYIKERLNDNRADFEKTYKEEGIE